MKQLRVSIGVVAAFILILRIVPAANVADFIDFSLRNASNQVILPGRLYVPPEATSDPTTPRPFILFMHGGGEGGTNNIEPNQRQHRQLAGRGQTARRVLYAPQTTNNWSSATLTTNVMTMIGQAETTQNVDEHRLVCDGPLERRGRHLEHGQPISGRVCRRAADLRRHARVRLRGLAAAQ